MAGEKAEKKKSKQHISFNQQLGQVFWDEAERQGRKKKDLAMICGCSPASMYRKLGGMEDITAYEFDRLCEYLEINPYWTPEFNDRDYRVVAQFVNAASKLDTAGLSFITYLIRGYLMGAQKRMFIQDPKQAGKLTPVGFSELHYEEKLAEMIARQSEKQK